MRPYLLIGVALLLGLLAPAHPASQTVVLVVRSDSAVSTLDSVSVRKLFLGVPVLVNGTPLHPIRNRSDTQLDEVFLQKIVAMSQSAYDRQILIGVNRQGWLRPAEIASTAGVLEALNGDPNAISFMWLHDLAHEPRIRVVRVLWSD